MNELVEVEYMFEGLQIAAREERVESSSPQVMLPHRHREWQFTQVVEGSLSYCVAGIIVPVEQGQCIFINSGVEHSALPTLNGCARVRALYVLPELFSGSALVMEEYISEITNGGVAPMVVIPNPNPIITVMNRLFQLIENNVPTLPLRLMTGCTQILDTLYFLIESARPVGSARKHFRELRSMLDFLSRNYSESIELEEIADAGSVSKNMAIILFERYLGAPPMKYLTSLRLQRAANLLAGTDMAITDIAYAVGFSGSSYFTKRFREEYGITPRRFRGAEPPQLR